MTALAEWLLAAALAFAPPEKAKQFPGFEETPAQARARYASIAADIDTAAGGDKAKAALLLAIALGESGLAKDVDSGTCYRIGAYRSRCDAGTSHSLWQVKAYGITAAELKTDRLKAAKKALALAQSSLGSCRALDPRDGLSQYATGSCKAGVASAQARFDLWGKVYAWRAAP